MFGGSTFVSLNGAGGQVKLAQANPPAPPAPAPAPAPAPVFVAPPASVAVPAPIATSGLSRGAQVAIATTLFGLAIIGLVSLTD